MTRRVLPLAALLLLLLPFGLAGCVVAPRPGYYAGPAVSGGVYVAPRPYYRPYYYPRPYYYGRPYYPGWRRW
jgi:hypothetical protein